jgi:hypothetical protein
MMVVEMHTWSQDWKRVTVVIVIRVRSRDTVQCSASQGKTFQGVVRHFVR